MDECRHEHFETRRRVVSNGAVHIVEQCLACGAVVQTLRREKWIGRINPTKLPDYDDELRKSYYAERTKLWQQEHEARRNAESEEWWEAYNQYLESPVWKQLRLKVLRRDDFTCRGCGKEKAATQVHHLKYQNAEFYQSFGQEMMFDLVSICEACHTTIHGRSMELTG